MKRTFFFPIKNRMEGMSTIPFDHVEPGAAVRVVSLGGVQYLSVFDLIMCVCEKSASNAARTWRHLSPEQRSQVMAECVAHTFPEQPEQPVITFQGAMRLVPLLPGDGPRKHRFAVASVLRKYHVGEASLVEAPPSVSTTRVQRDMDKLKGAVELLVSAAEERAAFAEEKARIAEQRAMAADARVLELERALEADETKHTLQTNVTALRHAIDNVESTLQAMRAKRKR